MARRVAWVAAFGLAAFAAPPALASDGVAESSAPAIPGATETVAAVLDQIAGATSSAVLPVELPVEVPAATLDTAAAEPAPTGAAAAPPPPPVTVPEAPAAAETVIPPAAETPVQPDAPAVQAEPTNVNVSIRVDSPGDDEAVTQVNVATSAPSAQYQAPVAQYQPVVPPSEPARVDTDASSEASREAETTSEPASAAASAPAPADAWEWSWDWNCGSAPPDPIAAPAGVPMENWIWNWNWNCGDEPAPAAINVPETMPGYHAAPIQYRPVNINVSIRINSPGSNGPVAQTNVAVSIPNIAVSVPLPRPPFAPSASTAPAPSAVPAAAAAGTPHEQGADGESDARSVLELPSIASYAVFTTIERTIELVWRWDGGRPASVVQRPRSQVLVPGTPTATGSGGGAVTASGIALLPGDTVAYAARLEARARSSARAAATPRVQARPARPAPVRPRGGDDRDSDDVAAAAQQSGFGLAPVGGPERSLPFVALMLVALVFAFGYSALVSARARPTRGVDVEPPESPG